MSLSHTTPSSTIKLDDSIDDSFNFNIEFQDDKLLVSKSEIKRKQRKLKDSSNEPPKEKVPRKTRSKKQTQTVKQDDNNDRMIFISEKVLNNCLSNIYGSVNHIDGHISHINESIKHVNDFLNLLLKEINDISTRDL